MMKLNLMNNSYYGNFRNRKFTDIFPDVDTFVQGELNSGLKADLTEDSLRVIYYLLYSRYGNSTIASSDENRFAYSVYSIIYSYGPTWEKRIEIQKELRHLSDTDLLTGNRIISNQSLNPSDEPTTATLEELQTINSQSTNNVKRSKLDAYALLNSLLVTDVTEYFIDRFKTLFLKVVLPERPLWYIEEDED